MSREERIEELTQELRALAARRDALCAQLTDIAHPQWEQRLGDYQLLCSRIHTLHRRVRHVREGEPELGYAVPTQDYTQHHKSRTS